MTPLSIFCLGSLGKHIPLHLRTVRKLCSLVQTGAWHWLCIATIMLLCKMFLSILLLWSKRCGTTDSSVQCR